MEKTAKTGVIIANTGTPSAPAPEAVRTYLQEFLMDPRICPMHPMIWSFILKAFILPRRSDASAKKYEQIWMQGGSPLEIHMSSLASKLDEACGSQVVVRHAMSYGAPSIRDVLEDLHEEGCADLVVIPLYPQSAFSTTSVVQDKLESALPDMGWNPSVTVIDGYADQEGYLNAIADSVRCAEFAESDRLLMAFHSIPMRDVAQGDTYADQVNETTQAVAKRLGLSDDQWIAGFQCRFDNRKWLGPSTFSAIESLGSFDGRLFVVTPNFSIDCLETLYDIEIKLRQDYDAVHLSSELRYVPCLNDSDAHVALLQNILANKAVI